MENQEIAAVFEEIANLMRINQDDPKWNFKAVAYDRAKRSIEDHLAIIGAIEKRDTDKAERLSRDHTLGLAAYVEAHGDELFG